MAMNCSWTRGKFSHTMRGETFTGARRRDAFGHTSDGDGGMNTVAKDARRIGAKARTTAPRADGLVRRIAAWFADDATAQRFAAERARDQRLTRPGR
jgi:hypothetical protein